MEDIKLPFKHGRMEDIGDEEVHIFFIKSPTSPLLKIALEDTIVTFVVSFFRC